MLGLIGGIAGKIQEVFFKAFEEWFMRQPPHRKVKVFLSACIVGLGAANFEEITKFLSVAIYVPQIMISTRLELSKPAGKAALPFSRSFKATVLAAQNRLNLAEATDLTNIMNGAFTPWATSQAINAFSARMNQKSIAASINWIDSGKAHDCDCWSELANVSSDFRLPLVAGWIMSAYADMNTAVSEKVIDSLLADQNPAGWWPTYPANKLDNYASTYSTAWSIIGFAKLYSKNLIPDNKRENVNDAIMRGAEWLISLIHPLIFRGGQNATIGGSI